MKGPIFVHFCGTMTTTESMVDTMADTLAYPIQIYVSGPGASRSYKNRQSFKCPGANNSYYTMFEKAGKKIITVEKRWRVTTQIAKGGVSKNDSGKVRHYVDHIFESPDLFGIPGNVLDSDEIKVFSAHSRGAAACLPAWAWVDREHRRRLRNSHLVFLDPVAGQTGNGYWMGNWDIRQLYSGFKAVGGSTITEIWARSAESHPAMKWLTLKDYNPARKFLYPIGKDVFGAFRRYALGFTHSSTVLARDKYDSTYRREGVPRPFVSTLRFLNHIAETGDNTFVFPDVALRAIVRDHGNGIREFYDHRSCGRFKNNDAKPTHVAFWNFLGIPDPCAT